MPKFYFDVHHGNEVIFFNKEFELVDLKAARQVALDLLGQAIPLAGSERCWSRVTVDVRADNVGIAICVAATVEIAERST